MKKLFGGVETVALDLARDGRVITGFRTLAERVMRDNRTSGCTIDVIIADTGSAKWTFESGCPRRLTARAADLEAVYKQPDLRRPWLRFAAQEEWLAKIPRDWR